MKTMMGDLKKRFTIPSFVLCLWATSSMLHCSVVAFSMKRSRSIAVINYSFSSPTKMRRDNYLSSRTILSMDMSDNKRGGRNEGGGESSDNINNEDFDDFSSVDEVQAANDLAKEFYQQMKVREEKSLRSSQSSSSFSSPPSDVQTWEMKSGKADGGNRNSSNNNDKKKRKFTGRLGDLDSTGTPSAGLFASRNGSVYAIPEKRPSFRSSSTSSNVGRNDRGASPVREQMMRTEFNLVSLASNELTLIVQGALVLVMLSFAIFIGTSGGITDGSDRFGAGEGAINEYNGLGENLDLSKYMNDDSSITNMVETIVKDDSSSVWL